MRIYFLPDNNNFESKSWFFLSDEDRFYIDVACRHWFVGFNILIKLDSSEHDAYLNNKREYLNYLAEDIKKYALSNYNERNIKGDTEREANEAIVKWLEESSR